MTETNMIHNVYLCMDAQEEYSYLFMLQKLALENKAFQKEILSYEKP